MKKGNTSSIANLSDDVLCAMIARNEVRKLKQTPSTGTAKFLEVFREYATISKGRSDKHTAELEKQRKRKITEYVQANLAVKDIDGNPTDTIVTD